MGPTVNIRDTYPGKEENSAVTGGDGPRRDGWMSWAQRTYKDHTNKSNLFQVADTQLPFDLMHR